MLFLLFYTVLLVCKTRDDWMTRPCRMKSRMRLPIQGGPNQKVVNDNNNNIYQNKYRG